MRPPFGLDIRIGSVDHDRRHVRVQVRIRPWFWVGMYFELLGRLDATWLEWPGMALRFTRIYLRARPWRRLSES